MARAPGLHPNFWSLKLMESVNGSADVSSASKAEILLRECSVDKEICQSLHRKRASDSLPELGWAEHLPNAAGAIGGALDGRPRSSAIF